MTVRHRLRARNLATASTNKIHDDAVARQYGFQGGLVPGVEVFGYAAHAIVSHFGDEWLIDGCAHVRLHKPVYDGRKVIVEGDPRADEPTELALVVLDDARTECATATAARGAGEPPDAANFPEVPLPDPVPRASVATLTDGLVLGAVTSTFDAERAGAYLDAITETLPVYRARRIAHPAWLLRRANRILARNVTLGPWIHVESEVSYFATLGDGETMSARGRVVRTWEHREHKFVTIDVAMFAGAELRPIVHVAHTAIFEPRARG